MNIWNHSKISVRKFGGEENQFLQKIIKAWKT